MRIKVEMIVGSLVLALLACFMIGCPAPHNPVPDPDNSENGIIKLPAERAGEIHLPCVNDGSATFHWSRGSAQVKAGGGVVLTPPTAVNAKGGLGMDWPTIVNVEAGYVSEVSLYFTERTTGKFYHVQPAFTGEGFLGSWRLPQGSYDLEIYFVRVYTWTEEIRDVVFFGRAYNFQVTSGQTTQVEVHAALQSAMHALISFVGFPQEDLEASSLFHVDETPGFFHRDNGLYGEVWLPWEFTGGELTTDMGLRTPVAFTWTDVVYAKDFVYVQYVQDGQIDVGVDLTPPDYVGISADGVDYSTLKEAVESCATGSTIHIGVGWFEGCTFPPNKSLTIVGEGPDKSVIYSPAGRCQAVWATGFGDEPTPHKMAKGGGWILEFKDLRLEGTRVNDASVPLWYNDAVVKCEAGVYPVFTNVVVVAQGVHGVALNYCWWATFNHCTLVGSSASNGTSIGIASYNDERCEIVNTNIVDFRTGVHSDNDTLVLSYSNIWCGQMWDDLPTNYLNINSVDPIFGEDYMLAENSPLRWQGRDGMHIGALPGVIALP